MGSQYLVIYGRICVHDATKIANTFLLQHYFSCLFFFLCNILSILSVKMNKIMLQQKFNEFFMKDASGSGAIIRQNVTKNDGSE